MPTARGRALFGGSAALFAFAVMLSNDDLYGVAAAGMLLPVIALVFVRWGRHRIGFGRAVEPKRVFAGGALKVRSTVRNLGKIPSPPLLVEDHAPRAFGGAIRVAAPWMRAGGTLSFATERTAAVRGRFAVGPMTARLVDPFGLAASTAEVAGPAAVVVYPKVEPLHESSAPEARGGAGVSSSFRLAASGDEFYAVRDYERGDDLRKIHWRSSARRDRLMIRQDEVRPVPRATILIDTRTTAHDRAGESMEWAISGAASVVWELARQGFGLRVGTADSGPGPARWGREAADPLLGFLASVTRSSVPSMASAVRRAGALPAAGGALIAFMPPPDADAFPMLARLARTYAWCGAILLDVASFDRAAARERAAADQRLAQAERYLIRAGWHAVSAGSHDRFPLIWQTLVNDGASRSRLASLRS